MSQFIHPVLHEAMKLPDEIAFSVGNVNVYWYGVVLACAILLGLLVVALESRRMGMGGDVATDLCLATIPLGIIGARVWYVVTFWDAFRADPVSALHLWDGGLSVYGALLFALAGLLIYALCKKIKLLRLLDVLAPGLALAQSVFQWGDFFNQQGYGPLVKNPALQWFPMAVLIERTDTIHYAAFFYEFVWFLLLFLFLVVLLRKNQQQRGKTFFSYLLAAAFGHAMFELLRSDVPYLWGAMKTSHAVCAMLFLLAMVALLLMKRPAKSEPTTAAEPILAEPAAAEASLLPQSAAPEDAPSAPAPTVTPEETPLPADPAQAESNEQPPRAEEAPEKPAEQPDSSNPEL